MHGTSYKSSVAIKAKRELEALRQDAMQKEEDLQMEIKSLQEKTIFAQNELKHQKTACEKHEDDFMVSSVIFLPSCMQVRAICI